MRWATKQALFMTAAVKIKDVSFTDNPVIAGKEDTYTSITINIHKVIKDWKGSLFAFEWLHPDGSLKSLDDLAYTQREKRLEVEQKLNKGESLPRPILGIGLLNTVEIGSGKAVILTLAAQGYETASVSIPKADEKSFQTFLA